ncbi:hypothetical protein IWQ60_003872 [Tieghemiomyces parasiticus]|uniref:Uncharacterized protein n=1 Tax=Tieghemiomyces parasiticus TaxID=78921 RepID=A0A9W8AER0_9FUNG|nr:hypothetical protein IWQ60_003872 [Tieghemiomyces parasiticus]
MPPNPSTVHIIVKHVLATRGPMLSKELFEQVVTFPPAAELTRSQFKRNYLNPLKKSHDVVTVIDRTKPQPFNPKQFMFNFKLKDDLVPVFRDESILKAQPEVVEEIKSRELAKSHDFWKGVTNTPHIAQFPKTLTESVSSEYLEASSKST